VGLQPQRRPPSAPAALRLDPIVDTVANGRNDMPAFGAVYSAEELQDVATYILDELVDGR
jgi:mono/diheme cytochrome c family protein